MQLPTLLPLLALAISTVLATPTPAPADAPLNNLEARQSICTGRPDGAWGCYKWQAFTCVGGAIDQSKRCVECRIVSGAPVCD